MQSNRSRSRSRERSRERRRSRSRDRDRRRRSRSRSRDRGRGGYGRGGGYGPEKSRRAPRGRPTMDPEVLATTTNIFVGNLSFQIGDRELRELFEKYGEVTRAVVGTDKYSGRSKGFGFIAYANRKDAEAGMQALNCQTIEGRELRLDWDPGLDGKRAPARGGGEERIKDEPYEKREGRRSVTPPRRSPSNERRSPAERRRSPTPE